MRLIRCAYQRAFKSSASSLRPSRWPPSLAHPMLSCTTAPSINNNIITRLPHRTISSHISSLALSEPTIYALSSAPGRAAIAIIRISGPACLSIYRLLCPTRPLPRPRRAIVRTLHEPHIPPTSDTVLDSSALVLFFPGPGSATGEDLLEFHVHGGPAIVKAVLNAISSCNSNNGDNGKLSSTSTEEEGVVIRYAEPGEFTHRAFLNGRLDLTQVEALGDALSAETEQQRRLSMRASTGALAAQYESWRERLLYARGELEALIDFSEDQHFDESPGELFESVAKQIRTLQDYLARHRRNAMRGEMLRQGISISLLGAPNAGKSSLLNRVIGREAAIVSQEAGTTRDVVEVSLDVGGYLCRLGDTAGLRNSKGMKSGRKGDLPSSQISRIEQEGMRRAKERAAESDVVIVVLSFEVDSKSRETVLCVDGEVASTARQLIRDKGNVLVVVNKADLLPHHDRDAAVREVIGTVCETFTCLNERNVHIISCMGSDHSISSETAASSPSSALPQEAFPDGIEHFLNGLVQHFQQLTAAEGLVLPDGSSPKDFSLYQESLGASERHRMLLDACIAHLEDFLARGAEGQMQHDHYHEDTNADAETDLVAAAEDLRSAADCLAKITGRGIAGDVEEVLGVVFEKFCVGK